MIIAVLSDVAMEVIGVVLIVQLLRYSFASHSSLDLRSATSILVELKTLSTSALIAGIDSMIYVRVAKEVLRPMLEVKMCQNTVRSSCSLLKSSDLE
jgi:hypothetical protein